METAFEKLSAYILTKMRMSHIYQPAILLKLLSNDGRVPVRDLAQTLLMRDKSAQSVRGEMVRDLEQTLLMWDESQIDYYEKIVKRHPTTTLVKNHAILDKYKDIYSIKNFSYLSAHEIMVLKRLCQEKIDEYITKRGDRIWAHRDIAAHYDRREEGCVFCNIGDRPIIAENRLCIAIRDAYPVTQGHILIIPKRHVQTLFDLYQPEINAVHTLLKRMKGDMESEDGAISGFNIGANIGHDAGQTIDHCHIHLIPRRPGDINDPRGGVRGVIPEKRTY